MTHSIYHDFEELDLIPGKRGAVMASGQAEIGYGETGWDVDSVQLEDANRGRFALRQDDPLYMLIVRALRASTVDRPFIEDAINEDLDARAAEDRMARRVA